MFNLNFVLTPIYNVSFRLQFWPLTDNSSRVNMFDSRESIFWFRTCVCMSGRHVFISLRFYAFLVICLQIYTFLEMEPWTIIARSNTQDNLQSDFICVAIDVFGSECHRKIKILEWRLFKQTGNLVACICSCTCVF